MIQVFVKFCPICTNKLELLQFKKVKDLVCKNFKLHEYSITFSYSSITESILLQDFQISNSISRQETRNSIYSFKTRTSLNINKYIDFKEIDEIMVLL